MFSARSISSERSRGPQSRRWRHAVSLPRPYLVLTSSLPLPYLVLTSRFLFGSSSRFSHLLSPYLASLTFSHLSHRPSTPPTFPNLPFPSPPLPSRLQVIKAAAAKKRPKKAKGAPPLAAPPLPSRVPSGKVGQLNGEASGTANASTGAAAQPQPHSSQPRQPPPPLSHHAHYEQWLQQQQRMGLLVPPSHSQQAMQQPVQGAVHGAFPPPTASAFPQAASHQYQPIASGYYDQPGLWHAQHGAPWPNTIRPSISYDISYGQPSGHYGSVWRGEWSNPPR